MRRLPLIRSIVATLLGFGIAAVVGATVAAPSAAADGVCCQVGINGLPQQFHAGAGWQTFQVAVRNTSNDPISGISVTLAFKAAGIDRNQLHLQFQRTGGWRGVGTRMQDGMLVGTSSPSSDFFHHNDIQPNQQVSFNYRLSFGSKVPSGPLQVWLSVAPSGRGNKGAQAGPYQSSLVGVGAPKPTATTPTPSATPSETITDTPSATDSQDAGLGGSDTLGGPADDGGSGMTWLAYTIGALLLLAGVGVIGTMLWRRGPRPVETEWHEPANPQSGYAPPTAYQPAAPQPTAYQTTAYQPITPGTYEARTMPIQQPPTGRHSAPTTQYPAPQDPYVDETMIDPR
jgi:hypothetical protein